VKHEKADFSKFGKSFQEKLAHLILQERIFCDQMQEVLSISFFELKYLQAFVRRIFEYRDKYETHPTYEIMATILRSQMEDESGAVCKQARDFLARALSSKEIREAEYIKDVSLDFCKKQKLKEAMLQSVDLLHHSSFDEISTIINDAIKLGSDNNFGYEYITDFEERYVPKMRHPVSTGWKLIDDITNGGLGNSELGVVIAPTGAGKSMVLVHLGAQAIKEGKTVVHYTLELQDMSIGLRYDSCLTGVPINDLPVFKEEVYEKVSNFDGRLIIKEYPSKTASTNTIKTHLEKLKTRGIDVDMIIVDYADLLRPKRPEREKRHELETMYEELRGLAQEFRCLLWTASQTNRSGLNAEVITMEAISEAFNKCFVADFICTVSRTIEDKTANTGRMFVAKNRQGYDGMVYPLFMDTSNVKIKVFEPTDETVEEINVKAAEKQMDNIKKKYMSWREEGKQDARRTRS
jgi:RecA/RadA recombinase